MVMMGPAVGMAVFPEDRLEMCYHITHGIGFSAWLTTATVTQASGFQMVREFEVGTETWAVLRKLAQREEGIADTWNVNGCIFSERRPKWGRDFPKVAQHVRGRAISGPHRAGQPFPLVSAIKAPPFITVLEGRRQEKHRIIKYPALFECAREWILGTLCEITHLILTTTPRTKISLCTHSADEKTEAQRG